MNFDKNPLPLHEHSEEEYTPSIDEVREREQGVLRKLHATVDRLPRSVRMAAISLFLFFQASSELRAESVFSDEHSEAIVGSTTEQIQSERERQIAERTEKRLQDMETWLQMLVEIEAAGNEVVIGAHLNSDPYKDFPLPFSTQKRLESTVQERPTAFEFSDDVHEEAAMFFSQFDTVQMIIQSAHRTVDNQNMRPIDIDAAFLHQTEQREINLRGHINVLVFEKEIAMHERAFRVAQRAPRSETYRDAQGNLVGIHRSLNPTKTAVSERITIYPTVEFMEEDGAESLKALHIDLEHLGYGKLDGYIHQPEERPIATIGEGQYNVYTSMEHDATREKYEHTFEAIAQGIAQAEKLFGIPPGALVKNVMIANSRYSNAQFSKRNRETIELWDDRLDEGTVSITRTTFHEAVHLIDNAYQIDRGDVNIWDQQQAALRNSNIGTFDNIDEDHWYPEMHHGGHSEDNPAELIASFTNTLVDPEWEKKIIALDPNVRTEYRDLLTTFEQALRIATKRYKKLKLKALSLDKRAPIFALLAEKKAFIDAM